jgi:antitoxin ParD1/3/4
LKDGAMPTRNISLTPEQDAFIDEMLKAGVYRNASEAMRDAIRALQQRRAEEELKLERLRRSIDAGLADLERATTRKSMMPPLRIGSIASTIRPTPDPPWRATGLQSRPGRYRLNFEDERRTAWARCPRPIFGAPPRRDASRC